MDMEARGATCENENYIAACDMDGVTELNCAGCTCTRQESSLVIRGRKVNKKPTRTELNCRFWPANCLLQALEPSICECSCLLSEHMFSMRCAAASSLAVGILHIE
jgi:hypothetical protein